MLSRRGTASPCTISNATCSEPRSVWTPIRQTTRERATNTTSTPSRRSSARAGSIRDDGPLPDTITDAVEAQEAIREQAHDADMVLMLSTLLHSVAVGNCLPSTTRVVCVDINPATVTQLLDRGSAQAVGMVTDIGTFVPTLAENLLA